MNAGDLAHLVVEQDPSGVPCLVEGEDGEPVVFYVESTDGQRAVIRYTDDEVELTVPVADLVPVA